MNRVHQGQGRRRQRLLLGVRPAAGYIAAETRERAGMDVAVDRRPLNFPLRAENAAWERRAERWVWIVVAIGAALRIVRYALRFPLWGDEVMLASSLLDRDYGGLLEPLDIRMCSPILFLWTELFVVRLAGFSEWTLRLVPLVSSLAGLLLFRHVARRLMRGAPLLIAVGIFAVSYYPIRHASEFRSYASDLTIGLAFLAMAVEWWREPTRSRWLWALAAFAPPAVGFSFPAAFVGGAVSIGLAWHVWKQGGRGAKVAFVAYNGALVGGFLFFMKLAFAALYAENGAAVAEHWAHAYPPLTEPGRLLAWLAEVCSGEMFAYPFGGDHGGSLLTTIGCFIGAVVLCRSGRGAVAGIFGGLLLLGLIAAALRRYPLGDEHPTQYLVGFICLFSGLGWGAVVCRIRQAAVQRRVLVGATTSFAVIAVGLTLFFAARPYKHPEDQHHRDLARWFWREAADGADVVCLWSDEGIDLGSGKRHDYLSLQRIYSPQYQQGETRTIAAATQGRLRCVACQKPDFPFDPEKVDAWLADMSREYELVGRSSYPIRLNGRRMKDDFSSYEVFEFVRKQGRAVAAMERR